MPVFCSQFEHNTCFEVSLKDVINVPLARRLKAKEDLPHIELRAVLYDTSNNSYLSSFHIMGLTPVVPNELGKSVESISSANCKVDENLKSFAVTSEVKHLPHICLILEFVAYCVNNYAKDKDVEDKSNQVTLAWASLPVTDAMIASNHKLTLLGGNPFN